MVKTGRINLTEKQKRALGILEERSELVGMVVAGTPGIVHMGRQQIFNDRNYDPALELQAMCQEGYDFENS